MSTFRTALRVVSRHPVYLAIYVVFLSMMGVLVVGQVRGQFPQGSTAYEPYHARFSVADRDGSTLSSALVSWLDASYELVRTEDEPHALQDALASGAVDCVIVVPDGFEEGLLESARKGEDPGGIEVAYGADAQAGALVTSVASQWLSLAASAAALRPEANAAEVAALVSGAGASGAHVELATSEGGADARARASLEAYLLFSTYTLVSSIVVVAGVSLSAFNDRQTRRRIAAAPLSPARGSLGVLGACLLFVACVWAWVCVVGLASTGPGLASLDPGLVALSLLALLPLSLVALSLAFLISQLGLGEEAMNACGNLGAMVMSFLGGAWVPVSLLGEPVQTVARLSPTYWACEAISATLGAGSVGSELLAEVGLDLVVVVLFALALLAVGLALGRARRVPA